MKAYLFSYNTMLDLEHISSVLNNSNAIETWISPYQGCAIILSKLTVAELSAVLRTYTYHYWYVVAEINSVNANGWLPPIFWEFVSDPMTMWSKSLLEGLTKDKLSNLSRTLGGSDTK